MRTVVLDFESYYDKDFSLRKMTPVEYILDARFETILCAVKEAWPSVGKPTQIIDGVDFKEWLKTADLENACVVSHNALFDMCILAWRYGVIPRLMVDTLGVSRALLGHELKSLSLANVAKHLQIGTKGNEVENVVGLNREAIKASGRWDAYAEYSKNDADLCATIYDKLVRSGLFPIKELAVMDMVLRCAIEPKFLLDQAVLFKHLGEVQQNKMELLANAMLIGSSGKTELMSNDKFADLLRNFGCEPPRKISPVTGKIAYAFAKTDKAFIELENHPSTAIQVLVAARLGHKSTLEEKRTERLLAISNLTWFGNEQKLMPIPLRYAGAHTGRLSGDWKLNMQNLPRAGNLRRALIAKPGHTIVTVDASQIEARIVAWICKQENLVKAFENGEDVYSSFASVVFGYPVNKKDHPVERFAGKTAILGLGYQVGANKFHNTIEVQSQLQLGKKIDMTLDQAADVVAKYRREFTQIVDTWSFLHNIAIPVLHGNRNKYKLGPCEFERWAVTLPNGLKLHYPRLHVSHGQNGSEWLFLYGAEPKKLYGGKLLENIVQALARVITMDAALRIQKRLGLGMQVHDELVYSVPNNEVNDIKKLLLEEMRRRPDWAPGLPLNAEVGTGQSYGEAK
jgi:DNA polymerase